MKYFVIFLMLFGLMTVPITSSFAISENYYSYDLQANQISNISSLDYHDLKKNMITASITNGQITNFDSDMESYVQIHVEMQDDGLLFVNIPKNILYLADHNCNSDGFILVDGEEVLHVLDEILDDGSESQNALIYDKNVKTWAISVSKDSKQAEIAFAFIIPDAAHAYAFGQRCLMEENGEFMNPLMQKNLNLELHQILCRNGFELTYAKESRPACVTEDTFVKLFERGWQARLFVPQSITLSDHFLMNYKLVGDAKIHSVINDPVSHITEISIETNKKSNLIVQLEREYTGIEFAGDDEDFFILIDGKKSQFEEPWGKNEYRTHFQLNIPSDAKTIQIIPSR